MSGSNPLGFIGLTYDDVTLLPGFTDVIPSEVDATTRLTRNISLSTPLVSAALDTVTEKSRAVSMARLGGRGILYRNLEISRQAEMGEQVKRTQAGLTESHPHNSKRPKAEREGFLT